jgi:hypothetical protein
MRSDTKSVGFVLWLWVAVAGAAYLYQFRGLMGPIARLLGVS